MCLVQWWECSIEQILHQPQPALCPAGTVWSVLVPRLRKQARGCPWAIIALSRYHRWDSVHFSKVLELQKVVAAPIPQQRGKLRERFIRGSTPPHLPDSLLILCWDTTGGMHVILPNLFNYFSRKALQTCILYLWKGSSTYWFFFKCL